MQITRHIISLFLVICFCPSATYAMSFYKYCDEQMGDTYEKLLSDLDSEDKDVRRHAACVISKFHNENAIPKLIIAMGSEDYLVPELAYRSLHKLGYKKAIFFIKNYIKSADREQRMTGLKALLNCKERDLVFYAKDLALNYSSDAAERALAAEVALKINKAYGTMILLKMLSEKEESILISAARLSGNYNIVKTSTILISLTYSENVELRATAVSALGFIGSHKAVDRLISLLNDSEKSVSLAAIRALGAISGERPVNVLVDLFSECEMDVCEAVIGSIKPDAIRLLEKRLEGGIYHVRLGILLTIYTMRNSDEWRKEVISVMPFCDSLSMDKNRHFRAISALALAEYKGYLTDECINALKKKDIYDTRMADGSKKHALEIIVDAMTM